MQYLHSHNLLDCYSYSNSRSTILCDYSKYKSRSSICKHNYCEFLKWRVIFISKNINIEEIELIYDLFLRCQAGDKSALNYLFETQNRRISRVDELNEEYRIKSLDSTLNPEMEKLNWEYENEEKDTDFKNENVIFRYNVLNKMLNKMKKAYSKNFLETGFENGVRKEHQTYKKYYPGEYDTSELLEIMYEVIITIFQAELDGNGCVALNGKKNKIPIIDGVSLLKNISYFCCIQANEGQRKRHKDISGMEDREDDSQSEHISIFDGYSFEKWQDEESEKWNNQGEILRLLVYADVLEWLRKHKDSIKNLFKKDSKEIQAIINTILSNEKVFENEADECLKLVKQKELQQLIYEQTGKRIVLTNISADLKLIEQRIIDHLFYSMNYNVGDDKKEQTGCKISDGYLQELDKKRYLKLFGRESMFIYKICSLGLDDMNKEKFLDYIREHDDAVIPILSLVKGRRKYDMINLIRCDLDVIDDDTSYDQIVTNIAQTLVRYYQEAESIKTTELKKQYKISDRFTSGTSQMWEADLLADCLRIRFWTDENTKHPVNYKISKDHLLVYEGYENYYFCDESKMLCFLMPKEKRVITKSDSIHNIFFDKIA